VLGAAAAAAFDKGTPVDPSMLDGRRLRAGNVSIETPAVGWTWTKSAAAKIVPGTKGVPMEFYFCQNSLNERETPWVFLIARSDVGALTPAFVDHFIDGVRKGSTSTSGMIFSRPITSASSVPFPGSYSFRYELVSAKGNATMFGYLASTKGVLLMTQCVTLDGEEPAAFTRFAKSIEVKEDPSAPKARIASPTAARGVLLLGVVVVGIIVAVAVRNRSRSAPVATQRRPPPRPQPPPAPPLPRGGGPTHPSR
jgi:hypothetical protein